MNFFLGYFKNVLLKLSFSVMSVVSLPTVSKTTKSSTYLRPMLHHIKTSELIFKENLLCTMRTLVKS